jgi:crotonobetainyl-CoA:carnitine CoA-transferase CaiB-like acyl-CoA transferase
VTARVNAGRPKGRQGSKSRSANAREDLPLRNVRVLDIASFMAAPLAAMWLGDFGADVVKVEHPDGDKIRTWGSMKNGVPLFAKMVNRNKRSLTLDLHTPSGQELLRDLTKQADVLVENFRPGTLARWGLDYRRLQSVNPRLVMLSISAFGQTGPYSKRAGFGTLAEAMSGFAHVTGQPDGPPTLPSFGLADGVAGLCGAYAVLIALHERDTHSGLGQHIDLGIYESMLLMLGHHFVDYDQLGVVAERLGSRLPFAAPRNIFKSNDNRWVAMSSSSQSVFERACNVIGRPDLISDPRFAGNRARIANAVELDDIFADWIKQRSAADVVDAFSSAGAAAAPVYDISDVFRDPHFEARQNIVAVRDDELGSVRMQSFAPKLSRTPGEIRVAGPRLGEHTTQILTDWLDLDAEEIEELRSKGSI